MRTLLPRNSGPGNIAPGAVKTSSQRRFARISLWLKVPTSIFTFKTYFRWHPNFMLGEGPSTSRGALCDCVNFAKVRFQLYFKLQHRSQGWWRALDVCLRHLSVGNPLKIFLHSNCGGAASSHSGGAFNDQDIFVGS